MAFAAVLRFAVADAVALRGAASFDELALRDDFFAADAVVAFVVLLVDRRKPTSAGVPKRAMLTKSPAAHIVIMSEEPPNETKGKGMPVTGRRPNAAPMLMIASAPIHVMRPTPK